MAAPFYTASIAKCDRWRNRAPEKQSQKDKAVARPALAMPAACALSSRRPWNRRAAPARGGKPGTFYFCTETLENCVVDGGTFWYGRRKIQIADIQPPRIKQAKCDNERKLGSLAKKRLWEILNAGEVQLAGSAAARPDLRSER